MIVSCAEYLKGVLSEKKNQTEIHTTATEMKAKFMMLYPNKIYSV